MKLSPLYSTYSDWLKLSMVGICAACTHLFAQTPIESANQNLNSAETWSSDSAQVDEIPLFFEDELDDIGPQYLLKPGIPPHDWIRAVIDSQWLYTSNPTLAADESAESTDLFVFTAQIAAAPRTKKWLDGDLDLIGGYRLQVFRYAAFTPDVEVNGLALSENNFDAHTLFANLSWARDAWVAQAGIRWTRLDNSDNPGGFYNEVVPTVRVSRSFSISQNTLLTARYEGSLFFTKSEAFRLQRDDFNDRVSQSISLGATHRILENFFFQPSIRVNYSIYTDDPNGDREDLTYSFNSTFSYRFGSSASIRFFTGYQFRDSNGTGIVDYENLDIGWGANLSLRF